MEIIKDKMKGVNGIAIFDTQEKAEYALNKNNKRFESLK